MKQLKLLVSCVVVGVVVALIYFLFEYAVHHSITYIWDTLFQTENYRLVVLPLCVGLTIVYFGLQHYLDPKSEKHEKHGLGSEKVIATPQALSTVLLLGYFSLIAGASLGPEAVLVPACMIAGTMLGIKLFSNDTQAIKVLGAAAIMALMASFFHSIAVGVLSLLLIKKVAKVAITFPLILVSLIASASAVFTLQLISTSPSYFEFPEMTWKVAVIDAVAGAILIVLGYGATFALKFVHAQMMRFHDISQQYTWFMRALVVGLVLALLYLAGGALVEFTGNESIVPMLSDATTLGIIGLVWVIIVKLLAIGWSKAMGYRGGLIFPMIFLASTLVAIMQLIFKDVNFGIALIATMVGILAAEKKAKILL